jgi:hypothetical protein
MKTKGAERRSGGKGGGGEPMDGRESEPERKDCRYLRNKVKGIVIRGERKLCRENKRRTKGGFCGGKIRFFMRSGSKGKKKPWQMAYPFRRDAASTECVFETAVKPFHNPIGLWVKGSCVNVLNLQEGREM